MRPTHVAPSLLVVLVVLVVGLASCFDPVHSDAVDALGPEASGVRPGPTHRPGQPCTVCHSAAGPAPEFTSAGTVYERRGSPTPIAGVTVALMDRNGASYSATTNDVGNFYVPAGRFQPTYPVDVELSLGGFVKKMETQIGRNGGCAYCHIGDGDANHAPAVFLKDVNDP